MHQQRMIFLHSSDELYGADRILLELLVALPPGTDAEVWLPTDLKHPARPLCERLHADGRTVRHVDLPIMRRAYQTPSGLVGLTRRAESLRRELRRADPHSVYCTTSAAFLCAPVARLAGVPRVFGHVQEIWSRADRAVLGALATACHELLVISQAVRVSLPARLQSRTTALLNATEAPREVVPLTDHSGSLTFVIASRWNGWKGYPTLLRAWDLADSPGRLIILGGPPPSGDRVDVPRLVAELDRPDSVTLVGEVDDSSSYLTDADVVLVPSDRPEPFGLVAIEAFARARPVIASAAGGLLEIVTHAENGWLFPVGDADALARVLLTLSRPQVTTAGIAARRTFEDRFTIGRLRDEWRQAVFGSQLN
ncbi:glycosyltransferase family 4 protein [Leekyejoonella antrihumi]|uniref:Glycosyltransferase family 4 protein n=1 Tax=Leekyejoonella antrihumi TaxID=1660198 RepID=A0A563DU86_9MICO|nr:glycosyltransferase family 4 protein [Leekyejoonella antrihumi]TWP33493.1 glycosyltransferase family 4 protein [Leekyejoonella antrihumi]